MDISVQESCNSVEAISSLQPSVQKEAFSISIFSNSVESDLLEESLRVQYQQINVRKYEPVSNTVYFYNVE